MGDRLALAAKAASLAMSLGLVPILPAASFLLVGNPKTESAGYWIFTGLITILALWLEVGLLKGLLGNTARAAGFSASGPAITAAFGTFAGLIAAVVVEWEGRYLLLPALAAVGAIVGTFLVDPSEQPGRVESLRARTRT